MTSPHPTSPRSSRLTRLARLLDLRTPLFSKEVTVSGRRVSTYITRAVYALLMLGLVSIVYVATTDGLAQRHLGTEWVQRVQSLAPAVSMTILWFQFVVLALLACVLTSPSFCDERRHGTLGALFTTPLTAAQMCLGKLAGQMVQVLILVVIAAPLMLALRVFGGLEADVILLGLGLVLSTALLGASATMFHSVFAKRPVAAASAGVLTLMLCYGLTPLALWALQVKNIIPARLDLYAMLSPPVAMGMLTAHAAGDSVGTLISLPSACWGAMAYNTAFAAMFFFGAAALVRRAMIRDAGERRAEPKKSRRSARHAPPVIPATPESAPESIPSSPGLPRRKRRIHVAHREGPVDLGDHPVRWRELRQPIINASPSARIITASVIVLALAWIHYVVHKDNDHGKVFMATGAISTIITVFLAAVSTAGAMSQERESRTLETLLCTPLSAWSILTGKYWGAFRRQLLVPAALLVYLAIGVLFGFTVHPVALVHVVLVLVPPIAFLCATGMLCSVLLRKGTSAATANFLIAAALWMGLPFGWAILSESRAISGSWRDHADDVMTAIVSINPVPMIATVIHADVRDSGWRTQGDYDLVGLNTLSLLQFLLLELFVAAIFCGSAFLILRLAARILSMRTGRLGTPSPRNLAAT